MANGIKYQAHEILNKVLNSAETGLQVDIVAGAEYAEDSAHTSEDTGNFILGVRNDTLAALGGADGDYVPFQMNASGALFVEVASSSGDDSIYVDDADWSDGSSKHTLVGGLYQSSPQSITDGDTGPLQVNANGNLIVDLSATDNAVLDAIAASLAVLDDWDDSDYANEGGISEWEEDDNPPEPTEKEKEQYKNANENLKRIIEKNNRWFRQEYEYSQEKDTTQKYIDVENSGNRKKKYE